MTTHTHFFTLPAGTEDFAPRSGMQDGVRTYAQALSEDGPHTCSTAKQQHEERNASAHMQAQSRKGAKARDYLKSLLG